MCLKNILQFFLNLFYRHPANHLSNNMPSHVVIRGGVQEPRSDNRRQVNHNMGVLNSNPMYQAAPQQPSNMAVS